MEENITKKQHYVPQFYLRQWTDIDEAFFPIEIKSKVPPNLNVFKNKSGPRRFCFENFFYANNTGEKDEISQTIEKIFAEAEGIFSKELPKIEERILNNEQITEIDKYHLSECALFLYFRGKKYRDESKKMTDTLIKNFFRQSVPHMDKNPKRKEEMRKLGITQKEMNDFVNKGEYSVDLGNTHHLQILESLQGFCNLLSVKYWKVYISREGGFITTDAPYSDWATSKHFLGNDFLAREQCFILSPRIVIFAKYPNSKFGKNFSRKDISNNEDKIQYINSINLMNSIRFGFHKNKEHLRKLAEYVDIIYKLKTTT